MEKLDFRPVGLDDYDRIYEYTSRYGEGSCQHSPVSMYSLSEKYGDSVCIKDGVMYTLRANLCDEARRVYLAPLTGGDIKKAFETIIEDASEYGKKAVFISLTERAADILKEAFPGDFEIEEDRDLAEYVYRTEVMAEFSGHSLSKRRQQAKGFWRNMGDRAKVTLITPEDRDEILEFEHEWVKDNSETHDVAALEREERMIIKQFDHYRDLKLSGIVMRIDGKVCGFGYGTALSNEHFDAIVEKGDRSILHIYKVLRQESVRQCAMSCTYVNMEEDVGNPGLRKLKLDYCPEYLLHKYIATQK